MIPKPRKKSSKPDLPVVKGRSARSSSPTQKEKADTVAAAPSKSEPSFFEDVWDVVRQIPKGRVTSYGAIAHYLGTRMSARMVGWAMNAAHVAHPPVPAQRVVNRNGMLTGKHHFPTPDAMEQLLRKDGVKVENDTVSDFKTRFWDPATELSL